MRKRALPRSREYLIKHCFETDRLQCLRENSTCQGAVERETANLAATQPRSGGMKLARRVSAGWGGQLSRAAERRHGYDADTFGTSEQPSGKIEESPGGAG